MVKSLDKKWKELLFSASGFGPNLLMVLMGAYFTDAINPAALGEKSYQVITGTCLILPAVFPILWGIAKAFDGIVDIPLASITDNLSTKWGRRRPAIAVFLIPMIISYAMCWIPAGGDNQLFNTIWIVIWALIFFTSYTMNLISFYGSISTVCTTETQRLNVSSYKAFFDTISYCVVYALVPLLLDVFKVNIDKFALISLPLMLTMIIPLVMIREGKKYGYPELQDGKSEKIKIVESLKLTFGNKMFATWMIVNCCSFFGLQMFLVGMNSMIIGGMGMSGTEMAILNTSAFGPVPVMLYLFNKLKEKKGLRFTYQTCLLAFAVAILSFDATSLYVMGPDNKMLQLAIGILGGLCGSWAIGSFFMMSYLVPAQIAGVEEKVTGKNHSAMYFAAQAVTSSIIGAVASSLVYENIKMLFISKEASGIVYAESFTDAALEFGVAEEAVFNLGTLLVPIITSVACLLGFIMAFRMPKNYSQKTIARFLGQDTSAIADEKEEKEVGETLFVQIALTLLSGFIFGFIWAAFSGGYIKKLTSKHSTTFYWLVSCFIPFASIATNIIVHNKLNKKAEELNVKLTGNKYIYVITGIIFPVLPLNIAAQSVIQHNINKLLKAENE